MPPNLKVTNTRATARGLDRRLEKARKRIRKQDQEETVAEARKKEEHRKWVAKRGEAFRKEMALYLKVFHLMRRLDSEWRQRVYCREEGYNTRADHALRYLHTVWSAYNELFEERGKYFDRHGVNFATELDALTRGKREVSQVLREWEAPTPSLSPSFRPAAISDAAVEKLRQLFPGKV